MEQVGAVDKEARKCKKPELLHFQKHGVVPKFKVHEFRVSPDAILPSGTALNARHFVPGQYVDVTGISIGKGFQGAMKRWGFKGQPATHGTSRTHRSLGSTGHRKTPGRTWKGKKMHGHMGRDRITVMGLMVYGIDVRFLSLPRVPVAARSRVPPRHLPMSCLPIITQGRPGVHACACAHARCWQLARRHDDIPDMRRMPFRYRLLARTCGDTDSGCTHAHVRRA